MQFTTNVLIPMRDGVRLAGNLYWPDGDGRHPCIVNYIPYHKDGRGGRGYAEMVHRHFVESGYAVLVVDFRGLGCSEGVNNIPFDAQEGRDGHDIVEWAAAQPWCDGNVGMWGVSYGGITALKAAAQRPPHLKAIVPIHATADNYTNFLLTGGCPNGFWVNGDWGARMIGYNLTPPLADEPDGRLAKLWAERLEKSVPWPLEWYEHGADAARWAERAIPVERIAAATYAVCGWHDFYVDGTLAYFNRIPAPKKLLMGPWKHVFPNLSPVEPVNFLELMVRWWDRWLRGRDNGADAGPAITIFVQGAGVWRHEDAWPPARNGSQVLHLLPAGRLDSGAVEEAQDVATYAYDPTVGLDSLGRDPWTTTVAESGWHNGDEARSLTFTTGPLEEDWELTGQALALLTVTPSVGGLTFTACLCDVDPDGRSRLVTMGWCPASGSAAGTRQRIEVPLRATSHLFRRGHRIRLSLALADFPRVWPTPLPGTIVVHQASDGPSSLLLPRTPPPEPPVHVPQFPPLGGSLKSPAELESSQHWTVSRELVERTAWLAAGNLSHFQLATEGTILLRHGYSAKVSQSAPAGTHIDSYSRIDIQGPGGTLELSTVCVFAPTGVQVSATIKRAGQVIYDKNWERRPGQGV
jgi:putative CocE/NonD family hydrolase